MSPNLFGSRAKHDPQRVAEIKRWAAEVFRLSPETTVMVTELHCTEPGCPPLETVIAILDVPRKPRQFKVHKAIADMTLADVQQMNSDC